MWKAMDIIAVFHALACFQIYFSPDGKKMESRLLNERLDIEHMRALLLQLPGGATVVDFEENILLDSVKSRTRLWEQKGTLAAFTFVDDFNNLWFEISPSHRTPLLEDEIVAWGVECVRKSNRESGQTCTLDASFGSGDAWQITMLLRNGFVQEPVRSLHYERRLDEPIQSFPIPKEYRLRCVLGEEEIPDLVALHRVAFGTDNMTEERRRVIMLAPTYEKDLDLVLVAPDEKLAAFCICGFDDPEKRIGYTDPIGTHSSYKGQGLAKAIVTAGLSILRERGAQKVRLGTSSENVAMQRLAESLGFVLVSEKLWFSKSVNDFSSGGLPATSGLVVKKGTADLIP
jgi:mycothiol synthase